MGQALSLESLERKIQASFSSRVLVSHGLFCSPHPGGSVVICELDSTPTLVAEERAQKKKYFLVQVIQRQDAVGRGREQEVLGTGHESDALAEDFYSNAALQTTSSDCESTDSARALHTSWPHTGVGANIDGIEASVLAMLKAFAPSVSIQSASYMALLDSLYSQDLRGFCYSFPKDSESFQERHTDAPHEVMPEKNRHPNLVPLLGAFKGEEDLFLVYPKASYTLQDILYFSPDALSGDERIAILAYGLLAALAHCHSMGFAHGDVKPSNILLTDSLWCWLSAPSRCLGASILISEFEKDGHHLDATKWSSTFTEWWTGHLSNYDYLLFLNSLAGRKWGDRCFHPVMPWVIDFRHKPDDSSDSGWRDLSKSKWRLAKGDEQLDFTYNTADIPHHVSDECLSELAVCVYKARILPLVVLRHVVRSVYEPNEYPATMNRLYQWTPDECIPEFYTDSTIFHSIHPGMKDLSVPPWADSPQHFIALHRAALESNHVSRQLHHWIDLTFGYKLSGDAAVASKNVPLNGLGPLIPRASGRRQLFSMPHPARQQHIEQNVVFTPNELVQPRAGMEAISAGARQWTSGHDINASNDLTRFVAPLEELENALFFSDSNMHLAPVYISPAVSAELRNKVPYDFSARKDQFESVRDLMDKEENTQGMVAASQYHSAHNLVKDLELAQCVDSNKDLSLSSDRATVSCPPNAISDDIFAAGCVIAELYLRRPFFDPLSAATYSATGVIPYLVEQLPIRVQPLVRAAIDPNLSRRPSARMLLKSCFSAATQSAYHFLSPLHLLGPRDSRLTYAKSMVEAETFQSLGQHSVELCASPVLSSLSVSAKDMNASDTVFVLTELLRCLRPYAAIELLLPAVRQLLLSQDSVGLKVALLQPSFIRELLKTVGSGAYIEHVHLAVLANLQYSPDKSSAAAACTVLVSMCHQLGLPIIVHQIVWPLLQCFGRDITTEGIEVLVGIGKRLGEQAVAKHLIPPLLLLLQSGAESSLGGGSGQVKSWGVLAMLDTISALDRLIVLLPQEKLVPALLQDLSTIYIQVLLHVHLNPNLAQCAAKALLTICELSGQEATAIYVLPYLKQVFEKFIHSGVPDKSLHAFGNDMETQPSATQDHVHQSRMQTKLYENPDISVLYIMYPALASVLGVDILRQGLSSWPLLEQILENHFNWKWEGWGPQLQQGEESSSWPATAYLSSYSSVNPANLLLDGVGWSAPQLKVGKKNVTLKVQEKSKLMDTAPPCNGGAWSWVPSKQDGWKIGVTVTRAAAGFGMGNQKFPWELNAMTVQSWKAHSGAIRALDVAEDENTLLTAGRGPKGASTIRQWKLATAECVVEYGSHNQTLQDVCFLRGSDRIASCDGSLRIWDRHTAEPIFCFSENAGTESSASCGLALDPMFSGTANSAKRVGSLTLLSGLTTDAYTCMHYMPREERILSGTFRGCLRFIDVIVGQLLFSWRCNLLSSPEAAYVSTVTSSGSKGVLCSSRYPNASSWIAAGDSLGHCKVLDHRSGTIVASWRAHDGLITKLESFDEHYLVSSSLDKTLILWELRRGSPLQVQIFEGHNEGVTGFARHGYDLLSAAGSKIGLSTLRTSRGQEMQTSTVQVKSLGMGGRHGWSRGNITTIEVLTHSRFLLLGTDEGKLKICT